MLIRFKIGDQEWTHLDLTGGEVRRLEARLGKEWGRIRPVACMDDRLAVFETFLSRTMDPTEARAQVEAMNIAQLEEATVTDDEREDDLPDMFEDGLPKAAPEDATTTG